MAAAWAVLAVVGGAAGFAVGLSWGWMTAVVDAFIGAWMLTGVGVTLSLVRSTPPNAAARASGHEVDLGEATDQMVAALRSAMEISERMDERAAASPAAPAADAKTRASA
ncbi:hypothetical protein SLNSH_17260 [Alsobacter soli]|uniref:Phage holin family protein n=1 Tax=Alsobacter soli TaxID=2109933 RepID=A0A2T1HPY6_9HYPH|nr:hypothetical protein [Alsobacter soli]PSC03696.1 hypothetical protein SLNSH_17260 [Alsobacter soli]